MKGERTLLLKKYFGCVHIASLLLCFVVPPCSTVLGLGYIMTFVFSSKLSAVLLIGILVITCASIIREEEIRSAL
jgi:ABC-type Fe3+ transport system permease subunit